MVSKRVIAIEVDRDLVPGLREGMPPNVEIVEADALHVNFSDLIAEQFHVVANLPYNIATALLRRFIEFRACIADATVMVQKEVAVRIMALPHSREYGPLSILMQYYASPTYGFTIAPGAFRPRPKVDSAVIRLEWRPGVEDASEFTDFVHKAFSTRRKKLVNNLLRNAPSLSRDGILGCLERAGIPADARPEDLSIAEFLRMYNQLR
jgi:16S rRNA (adenine1518-N6/adenine1519-N6)-dimethyltransferase